MKIKYYPEDDAREYGSIGFKFPINGRGVSNLGFFNVSRTTEEQAVSNYINLLLTKKGERYMHPLYGIGIQLYLFEPNTDLIIGEMRAEIQRQSAYWLPYIVNHNIDIKTAEQMYDDRDNSVRISITFSVTDSGANQTIEIYQRGGITTAQVLN